MAANVPRVDPIPQPVSFTSPWAHEHTFLGASLPLTDLGNSERMVLAHAQDLRFVATQRRWLVWDGTRFRPDDTQEIKRRAKITVVAMLSEAQVAEYRTHYHDTARPLQPRNGRPVQESK